jgi:hypothetical protein
MNRHRPALLLATLALLAACASPEHPDTGAPKAVDAEGWTAVLLPGKEATTYRWTQHAGRPALAAESIRSASLWRRKVDVAPGRLGAVRFGWWVEHLMADANVADAATEDAAARVVFAFAGDESRLSARTRAVYDLAEALTGERPPYATLMYVYETAAPVGSLIVGARSDRIRKIVLDSGSGPLRQWRDHERDLRADFRTAFGEDPGPLVAMAVMTDSDNTRSRATTWYSPPRLD